MLKLSFELLSRQGLKIGNSKLPLWPVSLPLINVRALLMLREFVKAMYDLLRRKGFKIGISEGGYGHLGPGTKPILASHLFQNTMTDGISDKRPKGCVPVVFYFLSFSLVISFWKIITFK